MGGCAGAVVSRHPVAEGFARGPKLPDVGDVRAGHEGGFCQEAADSGSACEQLAADGHATTGACAGGEPCYGDVDRDGGIPAQERRFFGCEGLSQQRPGPEDVQRRTSIGPASVQHKSSISPS